VTPTHTLLIVIPLHVENAQPGRIEAHRPEGVGGLRGLGPAIKLVVEELLERSAPDVSLAGLSAHVVPGDGRLLAAGIDALVRSAT
jgi:hypothetical protein